MPTLKDHLHHGGVALVLAVSAATAAVNLKAPVVEQVKHEIALSKHAWPDLTDPQKTALVAVLKTLPKGTKFDIVCNDAGCNDLAADIDDAMEGAGLQSNRDISMGPLGYGVGVLVDAKDKAAAEQGIVALKQATGLVPQLIVGRQATPGYVTILIGKYRK